MVSRPPRRFAGWLSRDHRPWLVVLDDLRDVADLEGLWPAGQAGRILITTANPVAFPGAQDALIHPVGVFSPQQALSYLMGRLPADSGKRPGAAGLAQDLGFEPLALAQASAVIASSALSCQEYRDCLSATGPRAGSRRPPAGRPAVTWAISADHADRLIAGRLPTRALLALAALLDGHGIPGAVSRRGRRRTPTWRARAAGSPRGREPARAALLAADGLLSLTCGRLLICRRAICRRAIRQAPRCWSG